MNLRQIFLFLILIQWNTLLFAQLTADSIKQYLIGNWIMCEYGVQSYYWDSDSGADWAMPKYDAFSYRDSSITFYLDSTYSLNGSTVKNRYTVAELSSNHRSPFKIVLEKTEYIFEVRNGGFFLHRWILGIMYENEKHYYFFQRPGKCEDKD